MVVLSGKQHMEDIRKAPEDTVSFEEAIAEVIRQPKLFVATAHRWEGHTNQIYSWTQIR